MKVRIIFNSGSVKEQLSTGWGFACLINDDILFDTGEKGEYLLGNMKRMNIDIAEIKKVVISHDHWDHTGGLWALLKQRKGLKVFACPNFSGQFKKKVKQRQGVLIEAPALADAARNIFVTGEISGTYNNKDMPEQALVVKTARGISIITGCAHPGILKIHEKVQGAFPGEKIYAVLGGFHLKDEQAGVIESIADSFKASGVKRAGPTHCSGSLAENIFKKKYGDKFISLKAGEDINI